MLNRSFWSPLDGLSPRIKWLVLSEIEYAKRGRTMGAKGVTVEKVAELKSLGEMVPPNPKAVKEHIPHSLGHNITKIDNANAGRRDRPDPYYCGAPLCGEVLPRGQQRGYCPSCKEKRAAGKLPAKKRAACQYKDKKCSCGQWFTPTAGSQKICIDCKEKGAKKMGSGAQYPIEKKRQFVAAVETEIEKGQTIAAAVRKVSAQIFGKEVKDFYFKRWKDSLAGKPRQDNEQRVFYTPVQKRRYLERVDALAAEGMQKSDAMPIAGKEILGREIHQTYYFKWKKQLEKGGGKSAAAGGKSPASPDGRVAYTLEQKREFLARVADMVERGKSREYAVEIAGKHILGKPQTMPMYYNHMKYVRTAEERAAAKEAAAAAALIPSLEQVIDYIGSLEDGQTLWQVVDAMDSRRLELADRLEKSIAQQQRQLNELFPERKRGETPAPPVSPKPAPDVTAHVYKEETGSGSAAGV